MRPQEFESWFWVEAETLLSWARWQRKASISGVPISAGCCLLFDLLRIALRKDFFSLIDVVEKQDKVPLERLNKYDSFDKFRDEIIEE